MSLPTIDELPPPRGGGFCDDEDMLRFALLPPEDAELRAAAVSLFADNERDGGTSDAAAESYRDKLKDLSSHPSRTPGGIAWKLAKILAYFADEDHWEWWRYLLRSALVDAIDLERARSAPVGGREIVCHLAARRQRLIQRQHELGDQAGAETAAEQGRLYGEWTALTGLIADTPAESLRDVAAKLRVLQEEMRSGEVTDDRDDRLIVGAIGDCERLAAHTRR